MFARDPKRLLIACVSLCMAVAVRAADYVVVVSIDSMGTTYMQKLVDAGRMPYFKRLEQESAWTANARNDCDIMVTLPNHTTMVTGRPVCGADGHDWRRNTDPGKGETLHSSKGGYVAGVFDGVHDHGKRTGVWATKTKFSLFDVSWDAEHGAPDVTGSDNGRDKVDVFVYRKSSVELTDDLLVSMAREPCQFAFVHYGEGDVIGHAKGWGSAEYDEALAGLDACVGRIMDFVATNSVMKGKTVVIITADHGGKGQDHSNAEEPLNYTIPFLVWGCDAAAGNLYAFNSKTRQDPGVGRPDYAQQPQPVRNGEVGNLALKLLGLGPIPGSTIGVKQDLAIRSAE